MRQHFTPTRIEPERPRRSPRTPRELRQRINKRAFQLSAQVYERYRAELDAAIAEGAVSKDDIEHWQPHQAETL